MSSPSDRFVQRWLDAALIDSHTAERIRAWELEHDAPGAPRPMRLGTKLNGTIVPIEAE